MKTTLPLLGRDRECRLISRLLDDVRGGDGGWGSALVILGEAGVGKSALLAAAAGLARDRGFSVLQTAGVQSEANVPYAALHQLLQPVLPWVDSLPASQRDAVRAAFAMSDAPAPNRFLIGLAALELLSEAAGNAPLLLIADDAHWLDRATADVLAFVARRVQWDPVVLLTAARETRDGPLADSGLPELMLGGLDEAAARDLLRARFPELTTLVRERLLQEAEGNPLALLELPTALSGSARVGHHVLPRHLPLTERLERAFAARTTDLPAVTRVLLRVAATDDSSVLTEIIRAAEVASGIRAAVSDLDPAVDAGLIRVEGLSIRFQHPLVRSAVYHAASVGERHAAHRALALVLAGDADRRVWHRAAAAMGWDPGTAAELEETAGRFRERGELLTAVAGYERAAALTGDPRRRAALLLRAAEVAYELGCSELVRRLLREADALDLGPAERARALWLGDAFEGGSARDPARVDILVETAAARAAAGDRELALSLLSAAAVRCRFGNLGGETVARLLATADRSGARPDDPRLLNILATAAPLERGADVLRRLTALELPDDPDSLQLLASSANNTGAFHLASTLCAAAGTRLREQGRLGVLARILASRAWAGILAGDFPEALVSAEEGARLAAETGQPAWEMQASTAKAALAGLRGDHEAAEELAARIESASLRRGAALNLAFVQYARAVSALGRGRHEEAYEQHRRIFEPGDPAHHALFVSFGVADLAEAAVHSGRRDEARTLMRQAEKWGAATPSPWLRVALRYARTLLADDEVADAAFKQAIGTEELLRWPFLQARLRLAYGEWLRRQRRAAESRAPLRAARDAFDALGAAPWGERARNELRAAGETSRGRDPGTLDVLTAQELQIVQMAAEGLSNREIGQRLYLSHRTVESHLYRAFPKLGITSRAQLLGMLEGRPGT